MIRLVRLYTGSDGQSHFDDGSVPLTPSDARDALTRKASATAVYFEETAAGSGLDWHNDPHLRYVVTLAGAVEFETRLGAKLVVRAGDILLAEDQTGGGHRWRLLGSEPWRRVYIDIPGV